MLVLIALLIAASTPGISNAVLSVFSKTNERSSEVIKYPTRSHVG